MNGFTRGLIGKPSEEDRVSARKVLGRLAADNKRGSIPSIQTRITRNIAGGLSRTEAEEEAYRFFYNGGY